LYVGKPITMIRCGKCRQVTCKRCKTQHSTAENCPMELEADRDFSALRKSQSWRDCSRCHAVVELTIGCHHIRSVYSQIPRYSTNIHDTVVVAVINSVTFVELNGRLVLARNGKRTDYSILHKRSHCRHHHLSSLPFEETQVQIMTIQLTRIWLFKELNLAIKVD
jgi:hypothetical protein